jgi:hypothetical protein
MVKRLREFSNRRPNALLKKWGMPDAFKGHFIKEVKK